MPDRIRNGVVKFKRRAERLPTPLRQFGLGTTSLITTTLGSITSVETARPMTGLTFDDGPDPVVTPEVLDVLGERGARATFFMLSERAEQYPEIARRVVAEGHEVALHAANHDNLTHLGSRQVVDRIHGGRDRLSAVIGGPIRFFRPPYGAQTISSFLLTRLWGMRVIMWSVDPHDWDESDTGVIVKRAVGRSGPGAIILLHDGWTPTPGEEGSAPAQRNPEVVRAVLDGLADSGLGATSIGELLAAGAGRKRVWFDSG